MRRLPFARLHVHIFQSARRGLHEAKADAIAPPGRVILVASLGAREAVYLYGSEIAHHDVTTGHDMPRINHNRAIVLELTIIAAYNYDIDGFAPALELLASGKLPLDHLIEADDVLLDELYLLGEVGEVGGQDGRGDLPRHVVGILA